MSLRSDPKISHGDSVRTRTEFLAKEHFRKLQEAWITKDGYTRNLYLEEFLPSEIVRVRHLITSTFQQKGNMHPLGDPNPSWWTDYSTFQDDHYTLEEAIEYLKMARDWQSVNQAWDGYRGSYYPRDPSYAQRAAGGYNISASIKKLEAQLPSGQQIGFDIIPQVFGEEDPSVNSGLNGNEFSEILTEKEKEEKAWIAKRNKTLLLIGSLFLFG